MEWFAGILRANPVIPVFLTIGLGFWIGRLKFRSFMLGPVAATLLIGVLIGQLDIKIPDAVKSIFFMLFLFSIAYSVGPQFFRSFRGAGLKQVAFALLEACICAGTVILAARLMGYDTGLAIGLFAGSQTSSATLGVAGETIRGLAMDAGAKDAMISMITASYAVTYVFGTAGSAWFLTSIAPMLLGGLKKVREETAAIEAEMDSGEYLAEPGFIAADRPVSFRAYRAEGDFFSEPRRVSEIEAAFAAHGQRLFVERLRINGEIRSPQPNLRVKAGDSLVLSGRREVIIDPEPAPGPEIADHELLAFGAEKLPVTVASGGAAGLTFGQLRAQPWMRGVIIHSLTRNNVSLPARAKTMLAPGDVLTLVGLPRDICEAENNIGYSDRQTDQTDMIFLGLGIAAGCFLGALSFHVSGVPIALSTSGGALLAGLFLGWLRNRRPTFGRIPGPVIWIFDNLGLNMFIAVVGLSSGSTFIAGLRTAGIGLFIVGIICTMFALTVCILIGRRIFHFSAPETLGCVAGARCGVASIGAIQDTLESSVPAIGYSVTYAVANLVLPFASLLVLAFA
ncbi:MAG: aspartate-alanine antiporter [Desulfovibrio sp.]|nr:aspartate-alanine antiporter [Desulfovibrio sp.]